MVNSDKVRQLLCDGLSSFIFDHRLRYSQTHDYNEIDAIVQGPLRCDEHWTSFLKLLQEKSAAKEIVVFGAGIWGETLLKETTGKVSWKCVLDGNPSQGELCGITVTGRDEFLQKYNGETIVVSSYKHRDSMKEQLITAGVPDDHIIDAGSVIYKITEGKIYFDDSIPGLADAMTKCGGTFVDGGSFDGSNTERFLTLSRGNGYSYCFEPDSANIERIGDRLKEYKGRFEIVPKAMWSNEATLQFDSHGDFSSRIVDGVNGYNDVPAGSIDGEIRDKKVSFIKMDIEGAELEALRGAEKTIRRDNPVLAISVYHKPEDIWTIPTYIHSLYDGYKLYIRHYSFSWYDTVLYAIP